MKAGLQLALKYLSYTYSLFISTPYLIHFLISMILSSNCALELELFFLELFSAYAQNAVFVEKFLITNNFSFKIISLCVWEPKLLTFQLFFAYAKNTVPVFEYAA